MDEGKAIISNSMIYHRKNHPPSGAPKIHLKIKRLPPDSKHQIWYSLRNFLLIWVNVDFDQSQEDCQNTLIQLRTIVNDIIIFTHLQPCIEFLTTVNEMKMFLIVGHSLARQIVPLVHDIPHLHTIYIFSSGISKHELWINRWEKVQDVHADIEPICRSLRQATKQCNQNAIAMSFFPVNETTSTEKLEQVDRSFLYSQIFKQMLLEIDYNQICTEDFIFFWRYHYLDNPSMLNVIDEFERDYRSKSCIWWYTCNDFIYQMFNLAILRSEVNIICYLSIFLDDLNRQIEHLYRQQLQDYHGQTFIVYRGQGLSSVDFEKLQKTKDGLICFNNFLSTNKRREVASVAAESTLIQTAMVGVLFKICIDPSISSIPFASIAEVSYHQTEGEILIAMNSVFRVGSIIEIEEYSSLYEVELQLIADNDEQYRNLMVFIKEETDDYAGWKQLDQGREKTSSMSIYNTDIDRTILTNFGFDEHRRVQRQNKSKNVSDIEADHEQTRSCLEKALEICARTLPPHHINFSIIYQNFAAIYKNLQDYSKAVSFLEKALEIENNALPSNHPDLATLYNNIGVLYSIMKEHSKAQISHEKGLTIYETIPFSNYARLAHFYDNIAAAYFETHDYSKALSFNEKALVTKRKAVPLNYDDLITSYTNIAITYRQMKENSKAIPYYEKVLKIQTKYFASNYSEMCFTYLDMIATYLQMKEYSKVVPIYEDFIEYTRKTLSFDDSSLAFLYGSLGSAYHFMGEYPKALVCFEQQLEISHKHYPVSDPRMAFTYYMMGRIYFHMTNYSEALSFHGQALEIRRKTLDSNDPELATSYSDIGEVYRSLKDYPKAVSFHEQALNILKAILPSNDRELASSYSCIGLAYRSIGEYVKALSCHEKALAIRREILPPNHPDLAVFHDNIADVYEAMGMNSRAIPYREQAIEIMEKNLSVDHPMLTAAYNHIVSIYETWGEYSKARSLQKNLHDHEQHKLTLELIGLFSNEHQTIEKENNIVEEESKKIKRKKKTKNK